MEQKNYVWYKRLVTSFLILVLCISSGIGVVQTNAAGKVKLNKTKVSLMVDKTVMLKVKGTKKKVKWTSKNKSIATVSAKGKVKAKKVGSTKIIARVSGKKYSCKVTVTQKKPVPQRTERPEVKYNPILEPTMTPEPTPTLESTATPEPTPTSEPTATPEPTPTSEPTATPEPTQKVYSFRSEQLLEEHYQKHGVEMGFETKEDYVAAANVVIYSPDALHKLEAEDGDDVYYLEATNEFVIVSTDGYIRTYFYPSSGKDYFDRQ